MEDYQKSVGKRLQELRNIFNNGFRCSAEQLAAELNESAFSIRNYEAGKAGIPNRMLASLYYSGLNPIYILTGEGSRFADNEAGISLKVKVEQNTQGKVNIIGSIDSKALSARSGKPLKAAAGLIKHNTSESNAKDNQK